MTTKAKRRLTNIDFSKEDAHIALVGPAVGGPANGADYALVIKALNVSQDTIKKMQEIKVTMEVPEFLRRFFNMYYEDAEILARLMGYSPELDAQEDAAEGEVDDYQSSYEQYIADKLEKFEIVKAAKDAKSLAEVLSLVKEDGLLAVLTVQKNTEHVFKTYDKIIKSAKVDPSTKAGASTESILVETKEVEVPASNVLKMEKSTMDETNVEMVEKAKLDNLLVELQKAQDTIKAFETTQREAIAKAKLTSLVDVVKDEAKAKILFKSLEGASDEDFNAALATLKEMQATVEKSAMFTEQGANVEETEPVQESAVMKALKAQKLIK